MKTEISWFSARTNESLISINVRVKRLRLGWLPLDLTNSRFVHMNENEWMNRMEMKHSVEGGRKKFICEKRKVIPATTHTSCFCIQIMFYAELWFHTDIHSLMMNDELFLFSSSSSHFEDECRDWICVLSVFFFKNISTWISHFIFRKYFLYASHISKIVSVLYISFSRSLPISKSRASPNFSTRRYQTHTIGDR
jgi:hypothetical protein